MNKGNQGFGRGFVFLVKICCRSFVLHEKFDIGHPHFALPIIDRCPTVILSSILPVNSNFRMHLLTIDLLPYHFVANCPLLTCKKFPINRQI